MAKNVLLIKSINGCKAFEALSITVISFTNITLKFSIVGAATLAPILDKAALTLDKAPVNVSLAFLACSPNALFIASENISKLI